MAFEKNVQTIRRMIDEIEEVINEYLEENSLDVCGMYLAVYVDEAAAEITDKIADCVYIPLEELVKESLSGKVECVSRKVIMSKIQGYYNNF